MKKISLITASLLLASNLSASSLEEAIKSGKTSADVVLYAEAQSNSGSTEDSGFTMGSIGLSYETGDFHGFKAAVGFRANHEFSEEEDGDYGDGSQPDAILHTANLSYTNEYFGITLGRQEVDLEWMGDYHEAVVLGLTAIPNTTITAGYTRRIAVADSDAALEKFHDVNDDEGAFVLDLKYEGVKGLVLNPYYYTADNIASWYGLKVDYDTDIFGVTVHGAQSDEDNSSNDGSIFHLEGRANLSGFALTAGYVTTDDEEGVGSIASLGDNINPFDRIAGGDGNQVYEADADTTYFAVEYTLAGVDLKAVYGQTDYAQDSDESEFDFAADYGITENLSVGALYVNVDAQDSNDDYDKFTLTLAYSF